MPGLASAFAAALFRSGDRGAWLPDLAAADSSAHKSKEIGKSGAGGEFVIELRNRRRVDRASDPLPVEGTNSGGQ